MCCLFVIIVNKIAGKAHYFQYMLKTTLFDGDVVFCWITVLTFDLKPDPSRDGWHAGVGWISRRSGSSLAG